MVCEMKNYKENLIEYIVDENIGDGYTKIRYLINEVEC